MIVYLKDLNKVLSDVTEHQISLQKSSKDDDIDWMSYVDRFKKPKNKVAILWENIRWTGALLNIWKDFCWYSSSIFQAIQNILEQYVGTNHLSTVIWSILAQDFEHS